MAERFTEHVRASERIIVCWAMGLTQHANSVATIREIVNFLLVRGNIGRPGAGVCPVRGHSNVQGDRTMGISERPAPAFSTRWPPNSGSNHRGRPAFDTVDTIGAMRDGRVQVFVGMGGNFASATPDTAVTHAALERCRLTVQVSTKLNMSHLVTGDQALILPTMGRTERHEAGGVEQVVTVEDSMGVVHASRGTLRKAAPQLLSEVEIVCGLAEALFDDSTRSTVDWGGLARDHAAIRDSISRVVPGFDDFNAKIAEPGGFVAAARSTRRPDLRDARRSGAVHDQRAQPCRHRAGHAAAPDHP